MISRTFVAILIFTLIFLISCSGSDNADVGISELTDEFAVPTATPFSTVDCEPYGTFTLLEGKMFNERQRHSWVQLADGNILLAGGRGKGGARGPRLFPQTEIFNGATGEWTESGEMLTERELFGMFELSDGRVLVAGGSDIQLEATKISETWDKSGNWTATGKLNEGRDRGAAVQLTDGRILYTGGKNDRLADQSSTEIFNPDTNEWNLSGEMNQIRSIHTATVLKDGRVIVIGGGKHREGPYYASAEVYDPETDTWEYTGSMRLARLDHTATLLADGRVLVAGGKGEAVNDVDTATRASAEVWDPETGEFTPAASMGDSRTEHRATLLSDGRVLVTGGLLPRAEIYDPDTDAWYSTGPMIETRYRHLAMKLADGSVILNGGQDKKYVHITSEQFNGTGFDASKACTVGIKGTDSPLLTLANPGSGAEEEEDLNEFGSVKGKHSDRFSELEDSGLSEADLVFADPVIAGIDDDVIVVPLSTPGTLRLGQGLGSPSVDATGTLVRFREVIANSETDGIIVRVNLRNGGWDMGDMELSIAPGESGPGVKPFARVWLGLLGLGTDENGEITATIVVFEPSK